MIEALHNTGFKIAIETNGTLKAPNNIDWICVSPKADAPLMQTAGHELKLVYPQVENTPDMFAHLDFEIFSLQPLDRDYLTRDGELSKDKGSSRQASSVSDCVQYCMDNPQWRLSLQTHKILGID